MGSDLQNLVFSNYTLDRQTFPAHRPSEPLLSQAISQKKKKNLPAPTTFNPIISLPVPHFHPNFPPASQLQENIVLFS